jgi:hypothetical protein
MESCNGIGGIFDLPDWQYQAVKFLDAHRSELKVGVDSMARMVLWSLESDANLTPPAFSVCEKCFRMRWEFWDGGVFNILVISSVKYRYRLMNSQKDTGVVTVHGDYAENTRNIFLEVFRTNQVTRKKMEYYSEKPGRVRE